MRSRKKRCPRAAAAKEGRKLRVMWLVLIATSYLCISLKVIADWLVSYASRSWRFSLGHDLGWSSGGVIVESERIVREEKTPFVMIRKKLTNGKNKLKRCSKSAFLILGVMHNRYKRFYYSDLLEVSLHQRSALHIERKSDINERVICFWECMQIRWRCSWCLQRTGNRTRKLPIFYFLFLCPAWIFIIVRGRTERARTKLP